jgi:hypothetical protein
MRTIQVRPSCNLRWQKQGGWEVYEGDGVCPVYCGAKAKEDALSYARQRAEYSPTAIQVLDADWNGGLPSLTVPRAREAAADPAANEKHALSEARGGEMPTPREIQKAIGPTTRANISAEMSQREIVQHWRFPSC